MVLEMAKPSIFQSLAGNPAGLFVLLAFVVLTFMGIVWFLGYLSALVFSAVVAGFVFWETMTKRPKNTGAGGAEPREISK